MQFIDSKLIEGVRKIAVVRPNALGDFIFILPALNALRRAYPAAEMVLLGLDWHAAYLDGRPGPIDRVVVVPFQLHTNPLADPACAATAEMFFQRMQQEHFDIALQLYGGGKYSNPFTQRLGARITAGLRADDAPPLDLWVPYIFYHSEVLRYLEAVALVGAVPEQFEPVITVTERDHQEANAALPDDGVPLVLLHPGATDSRRRWPAALFAQTGDALCKKGYRIAVTGNRSEERIVASVCSAMSAPCLNLCGSLSLHGLTGLLARSRLLVSNDTGPLHLARAVGASTVGLYWVGNMINGGPLSQSRHRTHISWRVACPECGKDCTRTTCQHAASFIADIPVDEVVYSAATLLAQRSV
jgi:ADP-heptose:LPS heptosyltransferase